MKIDDARAFEELRSVADTLDNTFSRHDEIEVMPEEQRSLLFNELHDGLEPHCNDDGSLDWRPEVVRIRSTKPI